MPFKPARFLDPKSDLVFKKIFGDHPDLIKSFLNGVLPLPKGRVIKKIKYMNPEQVPVIPEMKNTIVDVKCTDQDGNIFIVEMQMEWSEYFAQRLLYGASKAYVKQLDKGKGYRDLCPVYGIGLINDTFDHQSKDWFHHYRSINVQKPERVLEGLELILIELPKFKPQSWKEKKLGVLWLRFLNEIDENLRDVPPEFMEDPDLRKAMELAQESSYTKGELERYEKFWDAVSVERTHIEANLEKGREEGEKLGLEKGEERGLKKGREEGREEGKKQATLAIAKDLLSQGCSIEMVMAATKLTKDEIEALKRSP